MKNYLLAVCVAVLFNACSKKQASQSEQSVSDSKEGKSGSSATNCSGGTIAAGSYFMMNDVWGSGAGSQCIWYNNINSWGADCQHSGSGIKAYPAMVFGDHWGHSSTTTLPKKISSLGSCHTWWTQSATGSAWDAAYDIWFDPSAYPGNRAATYELMVWLNWTGTKPIAGSYDASGNAVPYASNVTTTDADGTTKHTWNIYRRNNVFSFLLTSKSNWISYDIKPLINYCTARGWMPTSAYMTSVQAGWEVISGGTYKTTSYGVAGI